MNNQTTVTNSMPGIEKVILDLGTIDERREKEDQPTRVPETTNNSRLDNIEKDISEIKNALKETTSTWAQDQPVDVAKTIESSIHGPDQKFLF